VSIGGVGTGGLLAFWSEMCLLVEQELAVFELSPHNFFSYNNPFK